MTPFAYPAPFDPFLLARVLAALPGPAYPGPLPSDATEAAHLRAAGRRHVRGRTLIAVISVLAIPALFFLARRFLEPGWALLASAFLATSLLNHSYSMQARPHTASAALSLFALLAALRLVRLPSAVHYAAGAVFAFVTIGAFQNGVFVLPALVLAHCLSPRPRWILLAGSALLVLSVIPVCYPFLVEAGIKGIFGGEQVEVGGQVLATEVWSGRGYFEMLRGFWSYDPVLSALGSLGLALGIVRLARPWLRPSPSTLRELAVVAAFPVTFVLVWGVWIVVPPRFLNPLVPFAALLAAFAARAALQRLVPARLTWRRPAIAAGALLLLAVPAWASVRLSQLRARDDTHEQAARWLASHVDREHESLAVEILLYLPLPERRERLGELPSWALHAWQYYQLEVLRRESALEVLSRADAGICRAFGGGGGGWDWLAEREDKLAATRAARDARRFWMHPLFDPELFADRTLTRDEIGSLIDRDSPEWVVTFGRAREARDRHEASDAARSRYGEPVARFLPFDEDANLPGSSYELGSQGFERVLRSTAWGPPIEIYRRPADLPHR